MNQLKSFSLVATILVPLSIWGQIADIKTNKKGSEYQFTNVVNIAATPVKNQAKSNTCWSYATNSFLESELLRAGDGEKDLSELYIVRNIYLDKAEKFVRMMGKTNFAAGGQSHDVINAVKKHGIVPQSAFAGKQPNFDHLAWDDSLRAHLDRLVKLPNGKLPDTWQQDFEKKINDFTGTPPTEFEVAGKKFTPQTYAKSLKFNPDDYVEIGSYTHHPFYSKFVIECPDNWAWESIYNVPLGDFQLIMDNALSKGYSVGWDADVSEKYFSHKNGLAIVPKNMEQINFDRAVEEATISPELRQAGFDNLSTQDDHLMHITGLSKDQTGKEFYTVKNSWGTERNECGGYLYVSKPYFQYKTIMIQVHKKAIPKTIRKKLGIRV